MGPMQLLIKPASGNCNLRCKYCFYYDEMSKRAVDNYGFMTEDTLENMVKKALEYAEGSCGFAFQGGEPTLIGLDYYRKFIELIEKYNVKRIQITKAIQTNGYAINEEWAKFFLEHDFLVGVSVDGVIHTHDRYRVNIKDQGSFRSIMKNIDLLKKYNVQFNILTVVNGATAPRIRKIYSFYEKQNWKYLQFINCLDPLGEEHGTREYSLTPEAYGTFLVELFELWYLDLQKGKQPYIREFENYIAILLGHEPEACDQKGCCSVQCVVEADGSVYPCDFYVVDKYLMGNLNTDSLEDITQHGWDLDFVQESVQNKDDCMACEFGSLCRGGCRRSREVDGSGLLGKQHFCESYKTFFKVAMPRMIEIANRVSGR